MTKKSVVVCRFTDNTRRHQWLVSIKKRITVSSYTYICSLHFKNSKKSPDNDIPTIFSWSISVPVRNSPTRRPFTPPAIKKHKSDEQLQQNYKVLRLVTLNALAYDDFKEVTTTYDFIQVYHLIIYYCVCTDI